MELSADQLQTLRHMLGIDDPYMRIPKPYRDYYCACPGDPELHALARLGAVECYAVRDGQEWFKCTEAGRLAGIRSHRTIKKSKSARVYMKYLEISDCWSDLTFKRFLTDPYFKQSRADA